MNPLKRLDGHRRIWRKLAIEVLVKRSLLRRAEWPAHYERLRKAMIAYHHVLANIGAPAGSGDPDPRELLVWAWCVLMSAPESVAQHYARLHETTPDGKGLQDEAKAMRERGYAPQGNHQALEVQMRWLGGLVRAIDADLAGVNMLESASGWNPADWLLEDYCCYVVPVSRAYRAEEDKERARRGMLYHAILPAELGTREIVPIPLSAVARDDDHRPWIYGAAAFDGMTIGIDRIGSDRFRLDSAPLQNEAAVISLQISEALAARCDVLVWPELTIPEDRLELIRGLLRTDPLADPRSIPIVVAGSWHVHRDPGPVNRSELLQGRGEPLGYYDKRRQYGYDDEEAGSDLGRPEDAVPEAVRRSEEIVAGERLPVIVAEDRLLSVAICRDFCDDCADRVYDWLGVDLVLVPSMGDSKTIAAHLRASKAIQSQHGAVTFVVQQVPVETGKQRSDAEPPAYSMATPPAPDAKPRRSFEQSSPFRPLQARR